MTLNQIEAIVTADGLTINGHLFDRKVTLQHYEDILGAPSRTIAAGPPTPAGHRNNQVHVFDTEGIYLSEHHASRLIESVNFVFDPADSPFPIKEAFSGNLTLDGQNIHPNMRETDLNATSFIRDLPGEYSVRNKHCWIGVSAKGRRDSNGKRKKPKYVIEISVCF